MPYSDGSFPSGSPTVTTASGHSYKCNSFSVDKSSETVQIVDENGAPSGALSFLGFDTGTMELQFPNATQPEPTTAAANATLGVFVNVNIQGANANIFATGVTITKPQRGPWLATVNWQKRVNA